MKPQLECIQCSVRQALEAAEIAGADLDLKREIALETPAADGVRFLRKPSRAYGCCS